MDDSLSTTRDSVPPLHPIPPIEIFEGVIDQASDNIASLQHLSLACRAFLPRARYHIFGDMHIHTVQRLESSGNFLDSHPWLIPLIRRVLFRVDVEDLKLDGERRPYRLWDAVPAHILSRLPNLCSWSMGSNDPLLKHPPQLSLHRLTLSCYRRYGVGIQNLEVSGVMFTSISDFTRLVSAFTTIQRLSCSHIFFRTTTEDNAAPFLPGSETDVLRMAQPLRIKTLDIGWSVNTRVVEYLLASSGSTVTRLSLTVRGDSGNEYEDYINRLEILARHLSQLSSLQLVITGEWWLSDPDILQAICYTTRILEHVERARLSDVRVEFDLNAIANLGCCIFKDGPSLETCRSLEDALLNFKAPGRIIARPSVRYVRAGRTQFWSPAIEHAFSRLNEQGLMTSVWTNSPSDPIGHEDMITSLIASNDSKWIATSSYDGTIIVWDVERGTVVHEWVAHQGGSVNALAFSPDSRRLVSAGNGTTGTLSVWDISNGVHKAAVLEGHTDDVTTCAWSPDAALIASASKDGTVRVWDAHTFEQLDMLEDALAVSSPQSLQFSRDGVFLAWRCESPGRCTVWTPLTPQGHQPKILPSHASDEDVEMYAISFDPENRRIATAHGSWSSTKPADCHAVRIWDVVTGAVLAVLAGHSKPVYDVSFSPDGRSLLSASHDGSTKVWDTDSWEEIASLKKDGEESGIETASFCPDPDGKYIATGSSNGTVRLWRTGDASCAAVFTEHTEPVYHVAFTPDGEFLASGDDSGIVHIRRLSDIIGQSSESNQ